MLNAETAAMNPARADVIEGYTLTRPTLSDFAEIEDDFTRQQINMLMNAAMAGDPANLDRTMEAISKVEASRPFGYGTEAFDRRVQALSSLPLILWVCLRAKQPKLTKQDAAALITDQNAAKVRRAVLELFGFSFKAVPKNAEPPLTSESPSSGEPSNEPSASAV